MSETASQTNVSQFQFSAKAKYVETEAFGRSVNMLAKSNSDDRPIISTVGEKELQSNTNSTERSDIRIYKSSFIPVKSSDKMNMFARNSDADTKGKHYDDDNLEPVAYQRLTHLRSITTRDIISEIVNMPFISDNVSEIQRNKSNDNESDILVTQIADYALDCLFKYGVCVIDNFLGDDVAYALYHESRGCFASGVFSNGKIIGSDADTDDGSSEPEIRGDKVMWLDHIEDDLPALAILVTRLDAVMNECSERCGHVISSRSKVMLTCYPGNGTKYKKHVDNAAKDGRCITCLYYQNKNWDCSVQGGMLKVYPRDEKHIANIEPLFDRLVMFWADERCPHKVLPVFADRYAVTMWYYDYNEREQHLQRLRQAIT